jgi:hypothetical protein
VIRQVAEFTEELGEDLGALADDVLEIAGDLAGQGEEDVGVFAELESQGPG